MLDAHCHILWDVDDGSDSKESSFAMLDEAVKAGVTSMHCTPHMRWDDFDANKVWAHYQEFRDAAAGKGVSTTLGFEVYYKTLKRMGLEYAPWYVLQGTHSILLEFNSGAAVPEDFLRTVYRLQSEFGLDVTLAHPERYVDCQEDFELVRRFKQQGISIQVSAPDLFGGPFNKVTACARRIMREGLCDQLVSDAHGPGDYELFAKACRRYL